ncbi:MAG: SH3 domain-containing protein [Devosia sp.]
MSSLMASKAIPFGQRRRLHPALKLGAATLGSLGVIAGGWMFLTGVVSEVAANAPPPRTDRQVWYVPSEAPVVNAMALDVARSMPVKAELPVPTAPDLGTYTHKVGVESLRVRSGPAKGADQVFALKGGTAVSLGETRNGWVEITTEDGRKGWVFAKFLNPRQG